MDINGIRENHMERANAIRAMIRLNNQTLAMIRRALGYDANMPEKEVKRISALAQASLKALSKGEPVPEGAEAAQGLLVWVMSLNKALEPIVAHRKELESRMRKAAKQLPVWPWCEAINGFGELGLAIIVGEAGNLSDYANPAKLWKRMGLAVLDGTRQGGLTKSASADEWIYHGYCPRRRSAMWTLGDALIKKQNDYRDLYLKRKAIEVDKAIAEGREVVTTTKATVVSWEKNGLTIKKVSKIDKDKHRTAGHIAKRAQRYVEKRLLRNLWRAWRDS